MSVHGIRTSGAWQKTMASVVANANMRIESFDYGVYGLHKFLQSAQNQKLIGRFYEWYSTTARTYPQVDLEQYNKRPSIVAHSLGSWIVGMAMRKFDEIRFDKIILAGSILPTDFDWCTLFARDQVAGVRNEKGLDDSWPKLSHIFVKHTGTAGCDGFEWFDSAVQNEDFDYFEHSDALLRPHIQKHWIPYLTTRPSPLSLLHGRNINDHKRFSETLNNTNIIDNQAFGKLDNYKDVEIPRGLSLTWIAINPDIYTFLIDRISGNPAGYINAMPLDDSLYNEIRKGKVNDNDVTADSIVPFGENEKNLKIYLMSVAIDEKYRHWGEGLLHQAFVQLITGFLDKLTYYAKRQGIRVTHFLATAWTDEGRRMCKMLRMNQVGKDRYGDPIFEVELDSLLKDGAKKSMPALRQLVRVYSQMKERSE